MITSKTYVEAESRKYFANKDVEYTCFVPPSVNREFLLTNKLAEHNEEAMRLLGELNAYSSFVPDADYFISMHIRKEAVQSSRIEGTYTDIDEVVLAEEDISPEKRNDWREVHNYIKALEYSIDGLQRLPLSIRLLNETHKVLLQGTRGEGKTPGRIRTKQNWIGGAGPNSAIFIPPHVDFLPEALSDLEAFWHNRSISMPKLIRIAVTHYQFETIHPYADGNGRIGRLLIMLQLINYGFLTKPTLYMSDFFEKNRQNYYDALTEVRTNQNLDHWLAFFLDGVIASASSAKQKFEGIMELRTQYMERILQLGRRAERANQLITALYVSPAINVAGASAILGISPSNVNRLFTEMVRLGILKEITGFSRNRLFVLDEYIRIFRS